MSGGRWPNLRATRQGIAAIGNITPVEDVGLCGVNRQTQPLRGCVGRSLHGNARQVRHGQRVMDDARAAAGIGERMIDPEQVRITVEQEHRPAEFHAEIGQLLHEGGVGTAFPR